MKLSILSLAPLAPLVASHFTLEYPPSRDANEELMGEFPCGGGAISTERTQISLSSPSFPIALDLGHDETAVEFLLALGSNPGSNFNITLKHTFRVEGMGAFCIPDITLDESVLDADLTDGMNFTLQVQSNAESGGGLYACADLQLTSANVAAPSDSVCTNNTGITAIEFTGAAAQRNANESTAEGEAQSGSSDTTTTAGATPSATASATDSPSTGAAAALQTAGWGILGAAVAGGLAIL